MNDGARDSQTLLHPAREADDECIVLCFQAEHGDDFADARGNFRGVELVGAREVLDVFPGFQVIVDGEKVGQLADVLLRFLRFLFDVNIIDSDASGGGQH